VGGGHIATGDFNGDKIPDLAVINPGVPGNSGIASATPLPSSVSILLGNGDGTFEPVQRLGVGINPSAIVVGDFNNDEIQDLAVANYGARYYTGTTVSILLGRGDGTFAAARNVEVGNWPTGVAVADLDGDEILDLAVSNGSIMLGNGDATFRRAEDLRSGGGPVTIGDFNGDGIPDLVRYDGSVLLGNGDGTFRRVYELEVDGYFVVGDFNGDGQQDLVVPAGSDTVSILLGHGDGTFVRTPDFAVGGGPQCVVVGDFNGDMLPDLAVANAGVAGKGNTVSILLGNGDGTFQAARDFQTGPGPTSVVLGDFNGDKILDLAVANTGNYTRLNTTVSILLGNGDGTFQRARDFRAGEGPSSIAVGDFNGDEILDLAVANGGNAGTGNTVSVLLGNGDGTFQVARDFRVGRPTYRAVGPSAIVAVDLNRDSVLDLAVVNEYSSDASILLGNGDGTFEPALNYGVGPGPRSVAVGDFDGDGVPDLAVANKSPGTVSILLGNGDGTMRAVRNFWVARGPSSVAVGDFNGDGLQDLAVANGGYNGPPGTTVSILLGNGDGTFTSAQFFGVGKNPSSVAIGDFDGDGRPDLVLANLDSKTVSVLINTR
jgi:hypothetical protein